uniref:Uncharacterized protein n=1 Tax=Anguilla anguilla TaxID=7936 RepID=A0A0E9UY67_ANGAN
MNKTEERIHGRVIVFMGKAKQLVTESLELVHSMGLKPSPPCMAALPLLALLSACSS